MQSLLEEMNRQLLWAPCVTHGKEINNDKDANGLYHFRTKSNYVISINFEILVDNIYFEFAHDFKGFESYQPIRFPSFP